MAVFKFKVSKNTLNKLEELAKSKNLTPKEVFEDCIAKVYDETQEKRIVYPIKKYKQTLKDITDQKGPYRIIEEIPSTTGLSSGLVKLENCEIPVPARWVKHQPVSNFSLVKIWSELLCFLSNNIVSLWFTLHLWVFLFLLL